MGEEETIVAPLSFEAIQAIVDDVSFGEWHFTLCRNGALGAILQIVFRDRNQETWKGRKWCVSGHATRSEIVQTCLKAVLTATEHEVRESFLYRGEAIFGPHHDVEALRGVAQEKRLAMQEPH